MIGPEFTGLQLHRTAHLVAAMAIVHQLAPRHVLGHYETDSGKALGLGGLRLPQAVAAATPRWRPSDAGLTA